MFLQLYQQAPLPFVLFVLFALSVFVQLLYYWLINSSLIFSSRTDPYENKEGVSIVLCAREEYWSLQQNLPYILNQKYHAFEVIVVYDQSEDESALLLESLARRHDNLKVVYVNSKLNFFKGKKFPQSVGIRTAKYDTILLTEVNCRPVSVYWISRMMSSFTSGTQVVLGYNRLEKKDGLLNQVIRYDHLVRAIRCFSFAKRGMPYAGFATNIAFKKELFLKQDSFMGMFGMRVGDDECFIGRAVRRRNTVLQMHQESHMLSSPTDRLGVWSLSRKRMMAGTRFFRFGHRVVLGFFESSRLLFFTLSVVLIAMNYMCYPVIGLFLLRLFSYLFFFVKSMHRFEEKKLLFTALWGELLLLVINPFLWLGSKTIKVAQ
ncbi:MAG: hypothetical protein CSA95_06755 [Bacteroidetes bacterium]|nr:MAG: hypothetical protein CSA95_06755 [Bacteroidota bacterium]PIE88494.1 MAG: hypothetical protein CSA04_01480 [Bacteroidota bacterium]